MAQDRVRLANGSGGCSVFTYNEVGTREDTAQTLILVSRQMLPHTLGFNPHLKLFVWCIVIVLPRDMAKWPLSLVCLSCPDIMQTRCTCTSSCVSWYLIDRPSLGASSSASSTAHASSYRLPQGEKGAERFTPFSHRSGAPRSTGQVPFFQTRTCASRVSGSISGRQVHDANSSAGGTV